jgi:Cdc6-like AAA superfamily ATPase
MRHIPSNKGMDFLTINVSSSYPRKAGQLTASIYCGIFTKLFSLIVANSSLFADLRKTAGNMTGIVGQALRDISRNAVRGLDQRIRLQTLEMTEGYKCLNLEKSKIGPLKSQDDYVTAVRALVEPLLTKYQRIIIAIDELENLRNVSASERLFFNDFLRHLHQELDVGLTIILVFTFNTFEDVAAVLSPAVVSRISERINFDFVTKKSEVVDYITECLEKRGGIDPSRIIEANAIAAIAADITKGPEPVTFRDVNKELHKVFSYSFARNKGKPLEVTKTVYEEMKKAVPVDDIIKELRGNA